VSLPANFYVPATASRQRIYYCRVCRTSFYEGEEGKIDNHMKDCSDKHENELREQSLRHQSPFLFDDQNEGDVEFREYVRRTGNWC
jgi:hypothetical protein